MLLHIGAQDIIDHQLADVFKRGFSDIGKYIAVLLAQQPKSCRTMMIFQDLFEKNEIFEKNSKIIFFKKNSENSLIYRLIIMFQC